METLAGRLKWERTEDGITVDFRAANDSKTLRRGMRWVLLFTLLSFPVLALLTALLDHLITFHHSKSVWVPALSGTIAGAIGLALNLLGTSSTLRLDPDFLDIGIRRPIYPECQRSYKTRRISNLRFASRGSSRSPITFGRMSELQFDFYDRKRSCFAGITESEAEALIAKMMEVYPFPKDLPRFAKSAATPAN